MELNDIWFDTANSLFFLLCLNLSFFLSLALFLSFHLFVPLVYKHTNTHSRSPIRHTHTHTPPPPHLKSLRSRFGGKSPNSVCGVVRSALRRSSLAVLAAAFQTGFTVSPSRRPHSKWRLWVVHYCKTAHRLFSPVSTEDTQAPSLG